MIISKKHINNDPMNNFKRLYQPHSDFRFLELHADSDEKLALGSVSKKNKKNRKYVYTYLNFC